MTDEDSHLEAEYEDRFVADTDVDDFIDSIDDEPTISDMPTDEPPATVARKGDAIYGGEGFGTVRRRNLLVLQDLPVYLKIAGHPEAGIDRSLQLQMLEPDIREAMAKACSRPRTARRRWRKPKWDENPSASRPCRSESGPGYHTYAGTRSTVSDFAIRSTAFLMFSIEVANEMRR